MSEIEMKIKEATKEIDDIKEALIKGLDSHLEHGVQSANAQEIGEVADAIKDLADAKEKCVKAMYYQQLMEAMSESKYGEDYDEDGPKYYRGRSARTGRYVHRPFDVPTEMGHKVQMRDMDQGRMYYSGEDRGYNEGYSEGQHRGYNEGHNDGYRKGYEEARMMGGNESKYDRTRKGYENAKEKGEEMEKKLQALQAYLGTITDELSDKIMEMSTQEKQLVRNSLQAVQNKI